MRLRNLENLGVQFGRCGCAKIGFFRSRSHLIFAAQLDSSWVTSGCSEMTGDTTQTTLNTLQRWYLGHMKPKHSDLVMLFDDSSAPQIGLETAEITADYATQSSGQQQVCYGGSTCSGLKSRASYHVPEREPNHELCLTLWWRAECMKRLAVHGS